MKEAIKENLLFDVIGICIGLIPWVYLIVNYDY